MKRYWIITLALILTACGGSGQKANFSDPTDRLEVVSWWVSPSEHPAFEVLLNAFKAENPDVEVIDGAIAGGGGSNVQVALAARCGPAIPRCVATFLGSSLRAWVDAGRIADVSAVYERTGLDQTMPQTLLDAATYRVKAWGVPTGSIAETSCGSTSVCFVTPPSRLRPRLHPRGLRQRSGRGGGKRSNAAVSWRQGQVHRDGAVREHSAGGDRPERMDRIKTTSSTGADHNSGGANEVRTDRLPSRPECRRSHVGSGGEEVGDGNAPTCR